MKRKKGIPHPDRIALKKWFGNLPVVEATQELRIQPNAADIKKAKGRDMYECVFSQACKRMFGSMCVVFFKTIAYVDLLDANGKRRVERFYIPKATRKLIDDFDAGKPVTPAKFVILPPTSSHTSAYQAAQNRKERRAALLKGTSTGSGALRPKRKPTGIGFARFRDGQGMVQFST